MAEHPSLLDQPEMSGAPVGRMARRSDPATSHAAAESMTPEVLSKQRTQVLWAACDVHRRNGAAGATAWDVVRRLSFTGHAPQQSVVARRLDDLEVLGLVERTELTRPGSSSRHLMVWVPTAEGVAAAA